MTPLEAQRKRITEELEEALEQLKALESQPAPDSRMINYYTDLVRQHSLVLASIEAHLPTEKHFVERRRSKNKH